MSSLSWADESEKEQKEMQEALNASLSTLSIEQSLFEQAQENERLNILSELELQETIEILNYDTIRGKRPPFQLKFSLEHPEALPVRIFCTEGFPKDYSKKKDILERAPDERERQLCAYFISKKGCNYGPCFDLHVDLNNTNICEKYATKGYCETSTTPCDKFHVLYPLCRSVESVCWNRDPSGGFCDTCRAEYRGVKPKKSTLPPHLLVHSSSCSFSSSNSKKGPSLPSSRISLGPAAQKKYLEGYKATGSAASSDSHWKVVKSNSRSRSRGKSTSKPPPSSKAKEDVSLVSKNRFEFS